jgi:hypothetical protein
MKTVKLVFSTLLSVYLFACFVGCTIIGYGIGASVDSYNARSDPRPVTIAELPVGREVLIVLKDNSVVKGKYKGSGFDGTGEELIIVETRQSEEEYLLGSVGQLKQIEPRQTGRLIGLSLGFIMDLLILTNIDFNIGGAGGFGR